MRASRAMGVMLLSAVLCVNPTLANPASSNPVGILTRAYLAQVNAASASPGLSVFEDETLSTAPGGELRLRVGMITIAIDGESVARLHRIDSGAHADLVQGELAFTSPENFLVEVHAEESLLRGDKNQLTQARVKIVAPKVLEVSATRGDLAFVYHDEFQLIPEGATYRIYLEAPAELQGPAGAGADTPSDSKPRKPFRAHKVAYFVVGGVALGAAAWGLHEHYESNSGPESPAKP